MAFYISLAPHRERISPFMWNCVVAAVNVQTLGIHNMDPTTGVPDLLYIYNIYLTVHFQFRESDHLTI